MHRLKSAALISKLSYNEPDRLWSNITESDKASLLDYLNVTSLSEIDIQFINGQPIQDTQAYIWKTKSKLVVSFRGTSNIKDAMTDISIRQFGIWLPEEPKTQKWQSIQSIGEVGMTTICNKYPDSPCLHIHSGFLTQYLAVRDTIIQSISDGEYEEFLITGHSLGAALATLSAVELFKINGSATKKSVVTIGSPRVGDSNFVKLFDSGEFEKYRIFNEQDPVPQVPMSLFYKHVGSGLSITDNGLVSFTKNDFHWMLRPFIMLGTLDFFKPILDHDTDQYIERLGWDEPNDALVASDRKNILMCLGLLGCIALYFGVGK
jgi:predicted lipase